MSTVQTEKRLFGRHNVIFSQKTIDLIEAKPWQRDLCKVLGIFNHTYDLMLFATSQMEVEVAERLLDRAGLCFILYETKLLDHACVEETLPCIKERINQLDWNDILTA